MVSIEGFHRFLRWADWVLRRGDMSQAGEIKYLLWSVVKFFFNYLLVTALYCIGNYTGIVNNL